MTGAAIFFQQIINGVSLGAVYALLALGFTLVYGILELINFAHFSVFMVGAFIALVVLQLFGLQGQSVILHGAALVITLLVALAITMVLFGALGVAIERYTLRPMRNVKGPMAMITTIGVSYILFNLVLLATNAQALNYPDPMPEVAYHVGGVVIRLKEILIWIVAAVLMVGLNLFVKRTKIGKAMRAVAQDAEAARMMGVDVDRVVMIAFFAGSALAGAAGMIFGLYYNFTQYSIGYTAGLRAFTAAVLGGIGNVPGAMLGGIVIGLIETLGSQYIAARWADVIIFSILIGTLVFRPAGLLGMLAPNRS
ncbi:branched-chain amino acid ABC transporter permease [Acidiphilium acidophilum]|uniref:Branched-chain amino acid ABC transporter permease n=1 Tax=Acidiphilium acidophilum TaxID=76588 RepID=A0AAW9DMJ7_ACIAO|nr:branched-chain amino acid ABC transporter permease [Acidiphilium acidophilum]MDX5929822.1 branched-chain amino acid ABC transporter permease [Acidiphilium acidophilum]GBQ13077.1 amino acid/amide ABC transporter permease [Acidiphilium acidophilum DSM 700]